MGLAAARYAAKARGEAGVIWFTGYNARNDEIHENIEPSEFNYERKISMARDAALPVRGCSCVPSCFSLASRLL